MATSWSWPDAEVVRLVDGDTLDMRVTRDIGFGGTATYVVRLRLNRINAPAIHTKAGAAALAFLSTVLHPGDKLPMETVNAYKFGGPDSSPGEWMAELSVPGNVSDLMVAAGHAVYWNGQGPRPEDG